ncbi:MAG: hypothetical protein ABFR53_12685 [Actinomycetota bacterium]
MDDLIAEIQERTNLSREKVLEVVTIVTDFMKEKLPEELVESISNYLGEAGEKTVAAAGSAAGMATGAAQTAKTVAAGATGKAVETATAAFSKATDTVAGVVKSNDEEA